KVLLAGFAGGIAMFLWEGVAHTLLPLGQAGLSGLDNESAVVSMVKDNVKQAGFYIFPGGDALKPGLTSEQKQAAADKAAALWKNGPSGIMIVQPQGAESMTPGQLTRQALMDVAVGMIAAALLAFAPIASFLGRLTFVTAMGLLPTLNAELPYWNWYAFP